MTQASLGEDPRRHDVDLDELDARVDLWMRAVASVQRIELG